MSPSLIAWIKLIVNESVETPVQSFNKETEASSFEHADRRSGSKPGEGGPRCSDYPDFLRARPSRAGSFTCLARAAASVRISAWRSWRPPHGPNTQVYRVYLIAGEVFQNPGSRWRGVAACSPKLACHDRVFGLGPARRYRSASAALHAEAAAPRKVPGMRCLSARRGRSSMSTGRSARPPWQWPQAPRAEWRRRVLLRRARRYGAASYPKASMRRRARSIKKRLCRTAPQ